MKENDKTTTIKVMKKNSYIDIRNTFIKKERSQEAIDESLLYTTQQQESDKDPFHTTRQKQTFNKNIIKRN